MRESKIFRYRNRRFIAFLGLAAVFLTLFLCMPELMAQEEGDGDGKVSLIQLVKEGGWAMYPLGAVSLAVVSLAVFNFIQLTKTKFCPPVLHQTLLENMQQCRVRSAIEVASQDASFLGRMMAYSLPFVDATQPETLGKESVEEAMADFTVKENRQYMNWVNYFSVASQAAPMLGLLGTVSGMIGAFGKLRSTGMADPTLLAGNISEALVTTATGLIIALPALFFYFFFKNRLGAMVSACHEAGEEMLNASIQAVNSDQLYAKVPEGLEATA